MKNANCSVVLCERNAFNIRSALASAIFYAVSGMSFAADNQVAGASQVEEIIVTARRREESIQDVPITINAFSEDYLESRQVDSFDDVQFHTPSMIISYNSGDTIEPIVTIRGVAPTEARLNDDPSAPIYYSDVVMTPSTGLNLSLYDIGNVQVLKGPQGTLFGRNSTAGAVLINPKAPGNEFGGFLSISAGNYDFYQLDFGVDVPVSDSFKLRIAGRKVERNGYQTNKNDLPQFGSHNKGRNLYNKDMWTDDTESLRLSSRWEPSNNFENNTVLEWAEKDAVARAGKAVLTGRSTFEQSVQNNRNLKDPYDTRINLIPEEDVQHLFLSNISVWDFNGMTVKNIFGYRKVSSFRTLDLDGMDFDIIGSRPDGSGDSTEAEQFSDEAQLLGTAFNEKMDWVVGAYYYFMEGDAEQNSNSSSGQTESFDIESTSYALFGQGTYNFDEQWAFTLGLRQSWDERDIAIRRFTNVLGSPPIGDCALFNPDANCELSGFDKFDSLTWSASLSFTPNDNVMLFGSVGTGYKSGGFNSRASSSALLTAFDEETVISYEVGIKSDWMLDSWHFNANVSLFYMDYDDVQVTVGQCVDLGGSVCSVVTTKQNAAEASYEGIESQFKVAPFESLELSLNYGYVNPKYKKWPDVDRSGNPIDRSNTLFYFQPEHELNASVSYILPVDQSLGEMSVLATVLWRDQYSQTLDPVVLSNPDWEDYVLQDDFYVVDLRFDWKQVVGSQFNLAIYVKNLEDETYVVSAADQMKDGRQLFHAQYYGEPRTVGASIRYSF